MTPCLHAGFAASEWSMTLTREVFVLLSKSTHAMRKRTSYSRKSEPVVVLPTFWALSLLVVPSGCVGEFLVAPCWSVYLVTI